MKTVLFLDVDGVLNSQSWYDRKREAGVEIHAAEIDPDAVLRLRKIITATDARIVLSSTWRGSAKLELKLLASGVPLTGHRTPTLPSRNRGEEIATWLTKHPLVNLYAILDDDDDAGSQAPHRFVQTDSHDGLTEENALSVIGLLSRTSPSSSRCSRCQQFLPAENFNRRKTRLLGYCKDCQKDWTKNTDVGIRYKRESLRRWKQRNPEKTRAHQAVGRAVRSGKLVKLPCAICGEENVHAHHHAGYDQPLTVTWLCLPHHREIHPGKD